MELTYVSAVIISVMASATLIGIFRKKEKLTTFQFQAIGLILVATFTALIALSEEETLNAAMGILGAIAGYIVGVKTSENQSRRN